LEKAIDRIMHEIALRGLKPSTVERDLSLSNGYLATMKKRKGSLSEDILIKVADYLNFSLNYLLKGEKEPPPSNNDNMTYNQELIEALKGQVEILKNALNDKQKIIEILSNKTDY
jgi:transcriptional regulator with XRE-family HTH domain